MLTKKRVLLYLLSVILIALPITAYASPDQDSGGYEETKLELKGLIQNGDFSCPQEISDGWEQHESRSNEDRAKADILAAIKAVNKNPIDIRYLNYPHDYAHIDKVLDMVLTVVNSNPNLFYVQTGAAVLSINGYIVSVELQYISGAEKLIGVYEKEIARVIAMSIKEGMSDVEKALALHDTLALQVKYNHAATGLSDDVALKYYPHAFTAYGAIVDKSSVCQGTSLAYVDCLKRVGVNSMYVSSRMMNHGWNIVQLGGKWYHVDITFDDASFSTTPDGDRDWGGYVNHEMFCKTDSEISAFGYTGWDKAKLPTVSTSKNAYDNFWKDVKSGMFYYGGKWFYSSQQYVSTSLSYVLKGNLYSTQFGASKSPSLIASNVCLPVRNGNTLFYYKFNDSRNNSYSGSMYSYRMSSSSEEVVSAIPSSGYFINELYAKNNNVIYYNEAPLSSPTSKNPKSYNIPNPDPEEVNTSINESDDNNAQSGWKKSGTTWYYYKNGVLAKGWQRIAGYWYYLDSSSGAMKTGWLNRNGWYYLRSNGAMATGWEKVGNKWYYLGGDGKMQTNWRKIGEDWFYFKSDGAMFTGWIQSGSYWYYLKSNGAMAIHWQQIGGKWYCFNNEGRMLTGNWYINGKLYRFNSNGVWIG